MRVYPCAPSSLSHRPPTRFFLLFTPTIPSFLRTPLLLTLIPPLPHLPSQVNYTRLGATETIDSTDTADKAEQVKGADAATLRVPGVHEKNCSGTQAKYEMTNLAPPDKARM